MKPSAVLIVRTGEDRAACVLIIKKERTMRKKLLFLVSVFVVALFTISMAQGPKKTTEPKTKTTTECCPQDCDHSRGYCADCACGDECRKDRCADCSTCAYAEHCRSECPSDARHDCRPARHCRPAGHCCGRR